MNALASLFRRFRRKKSPPLTTNRSWVHVVNVVVTATFQEELDLPRIASLFPQSSYRPEKFPGLVFKQKQPKMAFLLFHSGKMICTGAKSVRHANAAIQHLIRKGRSRGVQWRQRSVSSISNMVASGYVGGRVRLEQATFHLRRALYDPEQFSGIIYRLDQPQVVLLLFASGRFVCTGAKRESDLHEAMRMLQNQLTRHSLIDA